MASSQSRFFALVVPLVGHGRRRASRDVGRGVQCRDGIELPIKWSVVHGVLVKVVGRSGVTWSEENGAAAKGKGEGRGTREFHACSDFGIHFWPDWRMVRPIGVAGDVGESAASTEVSREWRKRAGGRRTATFCGRWAMAAQRARSPRIRGRWPRFPRHWVHQADAHATTVATGKKKAAHRGHDGQKKG